MDNITDITLQITMIIKYLKGLTTSLSKRYPIGANRKLRKTENPLYGNNSVAISIPNILTRPGPIIVSIALSVHPMRINNIIMVGLVTANVPYILITQSMTVNTNRDDKNPYLSPTYPQIKAPKMETAVPIIAQYTKNRSSFTIGI